jgi:hypothetical protein
MIARREKQSEKEVMMLPRINNKSLMDCTQTEFKELIENPKYRENQYLEYKLNFSFF